MADQENRNPQQSDPQKAVAEQKPGNQPNQPVQQKPAVPIVQPKSPQSEQEKHDQEKQSKLRVHWIYSGTDGSGRSG